MQTEKWYLTFEENGGEYTGSMVITAKYVTKVDEKTFKADGVLVEIDEKIIHLEQVGE